MSPRVGLSRKSDRRTIPWEGVPGSDANTGDDRKQFLTAGGVALSIVLVILKGYAGWHTGSTAVISDALNSSLDIVSYTALYLSVRLQSKPADMTHHYGHHRAEPLAGFLIAIFAAILGGIILRDSFLRLVFPTPIDANSVGIGIVVISIVTKIGIGLAYLRHAKNSPAMNAAAVDSRNDALASSVAMIGLVFGSIWSKVDSLAGLAIGAWVLYSGARVGLENIGYLLGKAPPKALLDELRGIAETVPGLLGTNNIRAHYVGSSMHVEVHIEVDARLTIQEAHAIAKTVGQRLEQVEDVYAAFVHADPVTPIPVASGEGERRGDSAAADGAASGADMRGNG
jgi:cation diffusion facilitator family transporter